jgi:hypothetical protein
VEAEGDERELVVGIVIARSADSATKQSPAGIMPLVAEIASLRSQ